MEEEEEEEVMPVDQNQDDNETKETTVEEENVPKYVGVEIETHRESRCKHYHSKLMSWHLNRHVVTNSIHV